QDFRTRQTRGVIDLRQNGNVVSSITRRQPTVLPKRLRQIAQILWTALDGGARAVADRIKIAWAQAGHNDAIDTGRDGEMASDPESRSQGDDGDGKHGHAVVEARLRSQRLQRAAQSRFGQFSGHEQEMRTAHAGSLNSRMRGAWFCPQHNPFSGGARANPELACPPAS